MISSDITETTRLNMQEKLAWAERSFKRLVEDATLNPDSVQDHFWSMLHAVHLLWFYFGRWVKIDRAGASAQHLIKMWKRNRLTVSELQAWDCLGSLRDFDAHVQPVVPKKPEGSHLLCDRKTGRLLCSAKTGRLLCSKSKPFRVVQDGLEVDLLPLCENGLAAYRKLVQEFAQI